MLQIERLNARRHDRAAFDCGEPSPDRYLREQAAQHHRDGIATTHVLIDDAAPGRVLGYYSLWAAQLLLTDLQDSDRRRLPRYPVPAVRMGRLAIAHDEQGKGHGGLLLARAVTRCLELPEHLGVCVLLVDALDRKAAAFYRTYGFRATAANVLTLYLTLGVA